MPQNKSEILAQIEADIISDNICENLAQTAKNLVMGEGSLDARIMFIGEAPGKTEDELGRPFVGAAGKFLDEMLDMIDMKRSDVYITNIVKYRPPNNRDPEPVEKRAFLPYLVRQIEVIQPKVVATLGKHSMNLFLPDMQVSKIHGQPKRIKLHLTNKEQETGNKDNQNTLVILPLYHPAAALYNGAMRSTLLEDFKKIPKILEIINKNN
ncbi:uracil-DNA glycosylase [Candidatus Saccharibacteria bacterium CPR2]|nr:uracil-DNA glycosylase [Candidatus Saccharibacteria bacterium CPR2]